MRPFLCTLALASVLLTGCLFPRAKALPVAWDALGRTEEARRTRLYLAVPKVEPGVRLPGIVLVHPKGGAVSRRWALYWKDRGYAAIALSEGCDLSGFGAAGEIPAEQKMYRCVADVLRARAVLGAREDVDADRIGVCGVSAGGVVATLAAASGPRFAFVVSVHGCGFLEEGSSWERRFRGESDEANWRTWCALWDPRHYLARVKCPLLLLGGMEDAGFTPSCVQQSAACAGGDVVRVSRPRLAPDYDPATCSSAELEDFADGAVGLAPHYPRATGISVRDKVSRAKFQMEGRAADFASFHWTEDVGAWPDRIWKDFPADFDGKTAEAPVPAGATAWYFNVFFDDGHVVSSDLMIDD